ncbi:putative phage tail protein [Cohnella thailandensis]|uniref:YmfQ family protein n=1 Tax=Cohnella thailandensis TaxID=557557 RepID=A0A841T2X2_9BACL|nr:YmfQ family protein [Cohnella thailandensis]MBP1976688.1 hypothetical protein [Cohnella thailandensis]
MAYGETSYGNLLFSEEPESGGSSPGNPPDLLSYLPYYYANSRVMKALQATIAEEAAQQRFALDETLRQRFVSTATWGLDRWEDELGLTVDPSKTIERRREQVMAALRGVGTTTSAAIVSAAAAFSGGEVRVTEYPAEYRFEIQFIGVKGIPANMAGFLSMLEAIKPAHLVYSIKYTYTTWDQLSGLRWSDAALKTWNELKVYEGE